MLFIYTNNLACYLYQVQLFRFREKKKNQLILSFFPFTVKFVIVFEETAFLESAPFVLIKSVQFDDCTLCFYCHNVSYYNIYQKVELNTNIVMT